jgi:hypothetical protein
MIAFSTITLFALIANFALAQSSSPLVEAVKTGEETKVKQLLETGANLDGADLQGWTPLMHAILAGHEKIALLLVEKGANPNLTSTKAANGMTSGIGALHLAAYQGFGLTAAQLIQKGVKLDTKDADGKRAFDYAIKHGSYFVTALLWNSSFTTPAEAMKAELAPGVQCVPLEKSYSKIFVAPFIVSTKLREKYFDSIEEIEYTTVKLLKACNRFVEVGRYAGDNIKDPSALRIRAEIEDMKIKGTAARVIAGPFAGKSHVTIKLKLEEASTGKILREQILSSKNSSWGAAYSMGASDRSLPSDMGGLVAGYTLAIQPQ